MTTSIPSRPSANPGKDGVAARSMGSASALSSADPIRDGCPEPKAAPLPETERHGNPLAPGNNVC